MSVESPCRQVCGLDPTRSFCRTCRRTLGEIAGWGAMSDGDRAAVMATLPDRDDAELRRIAEADLAARRARRTRRG